MVETAQERPTSRPAGYAALIERYNLDTIPNWHQSKVTTSGIHRVNAREDVIEEIYPLKYWPGETLGNHLEFALKYDGTNLAILASLFQNIEKDNFLEYVRSKPTGKYARRLWFLYEFLTGKTLPLDDLTRGNYVDLLEPDAYYTVAPARPIRRQRINDNLLGDRRFCPTIRRTAILRDLETADLPARCQRIVSRYDPALLKRALGYLYTKETKSSFAIEQINPTSTRTERFVALLQLAEQEDFCRKAQLVRGAKPHCRCTVSRGRLPSDPELRRGDGRLAKRTHLLCKPGTCRLTRLDGGAASCPRTHGSRPCARGDAGCGHRLWFCLSAPL